MPAAFTWTLVTPPPPASSATGDAAVSGAAVPRDFKLDLVERRMVRENGSFVFARGAYAVLQDVWLALGFFEGEWYLDLDRGLPYFRKILVKAPVLDDVRAIYRTAILARAGVRELLALDLVFNRQARELAISFRINTDVGELATSRTFTVGS